MGSAAHFVPLHASAGYSVEQGLHAVLVKVADPLAGLALPYGRLLVGVGLVGRVGILLDALQVN